MFDPAGIANWSVTHVDWSEKKWHPKSYKRRDVSYELLRSIAVRIALPYFLILRPVYFLITLFCVCAVYYWERAYYKWSKGMLSLYRIESVSYCSWIAWYMVWTSSRKLQEEVQIRPCLWNGNERPCYLFARKFAAETLDTLLQLFPNYTSSWMESTRILLVDLNSIYNIFIFNGGTVQVSEWRKMKELQRHL